MGTTDTIGTNQTALPNVNPKRATYFVSAFRVIPISPTDKDKSLSDDYLALSTFSSMWTFLYR